MDPIVQQLSGTHDSLLSQMKNTIANFANSFATIDFSLLKYHLIWNEKHDLLVQFGWFYLNELPVEIIDLIYENREEITVEQVDNIIIQHFRSNQCFNLKQIVKKWESSECFKVRERIFHEAMVNHSRRYFNSSLTLLVLHTEGVITDFVRIILRTPRFKADKAIMDISDFIGEMPANELSISDWNIYNIVFERILASFTEQFELANPDNSSNKSRHKIAHGHATEVECELNSLKQFLYLNEIYRLFSLINEKKDS